MLSLYRRHRRHCKGGHSHDTRSSEYDERKKGWKRCECPIFISGTLKGNFKRENSGQWEWDLARGVAKSYEAADAWTDVPATDEPPQVPIEIRSLRVAVAEAIKIFLTNREGEAIKPTTVRKYKTFTKQLAAFTDARGYVFLDQITPADMDVFYSQMKLGIRAKAARLGTLRSFFRFAVNREWLTKTPVSSDLKPPVGANRLANKAPFTDSDLTRILDACDRMPDTNWKSGSGQGVWTGQDVKDFIWAMIYTGLRISDVGLFSMSRLHGNEVFLRAKKNGGEVFAYIPDWLCDRLKERAKRHGDRLFIVGKSDRLETVTDMWRRKINHVFALAGAFEESPTPHRFRHTFARILLERGVPMADVADLLGDDEKTVRQHYSRWVPERPARLTGILKQAFEDKPRPKLVTLGPR